MASTPGAAVGGNGGRVATDLVVGAKLPPSGIHDTRLVKVDRRRHKVFHADVPAVLQDLNAPEWQDTNFMKNTFTIPTDTKRNRKTTKRFPYCLLAFGPAATSLRERMIVVNWWLNLSNQEQTEKWSRLPLLFYRPSKSADMLKFNTQTKQAKKKAEVQEVKDSPATQSNKKARMEEEKVCLTASGHRVVSREEWLKARLAHLEKEKALDKERDRLSAERRELPWVKVEKDYVFVDSEDGSRHTLSDLFNGRSQLIVYHFMFGEDWAAGCQSCSYLSDHLDGLGIHLFNRDISLVVVSKAPPKALAAYKKRMGWKFRWLSSLDNDFNEDYNVSFSREDVDNHNITYNYKANVTFPSTEAPGASVFAKDGNAVYHTYSTYARGLDKLIGAYHFMDMVPKGRDEGDLSYSMAWVRRHDEYDE